MTVMTFLSKTIFLISLTSFLLMTISFKKTESFGKHKSEKCGQMKKGCNFRETKIKTMMNEMEHEANIYIDPHYNCNKPEKNIVQKIPYQSTSYFSNSHGTIDVNLSSACIRCGICLSIAQQINQTLMDVHESMLPLVWLNETEASNLLRTICDNSFKHFSLRDLNGNYKICDRQAGATLVTSSVDGLWEKHLRTKCHHYLDEMGPMRLYKRWQRWCNGADDEPKTEDLSTILCRDDTTFFRDCKSIAENNVQKTTTPSEDFETHVKILAELKWK